MKKHAVMVVDDHPFFRSGLVHWLNKQPDLSCCAEADSVASARVTLPKCKPDAILLDLHLPDGDGMDLAAEISREFPEIRIIALSYRDETVFAHRALKAGARGYVMKSEAGDTLRTAISAVLDGKIYVSRKVAAMALENLFPDPLMKDPNLARLSDREIEVFRMIGGGMGSRAIGEALKISSKTVETYRERLKEKLGQPDSASLVKLATGWVETGTLAPLDKRKE